MDADRRILDEVVELAPSLPDVAFGALQLAQRAAQAFRSTP
jgi:hypothetical protein